MSRAWELANSRVDSEEDVINIDAKAGRKNYIINGNFDIWQRGDSQTTNGYGSDDRWNNAHSGSTKVHEKVAFTLGQTDVPGEPKFFSRTTVTSVPGAGNLVYKHHSVESVRTLAGQVATLSFWAKADASKNIAVEFSQWFGSGGTPSATITGIGVTTIPLTTSWQKFTVTVDIPSITGKTLGTDGNDRLLVAFWFDAGSNYDTRTNSLGQQSGLFDIAQVQLEKGSQATDFEYRSYGEELALCQRYYQSLLNSGGVCYIPAVYRSTSASAFFIVPILTRMRSTPTVSGEFSYSVDGGGYTAFSPIVYVVSTLISLGTGIAHGNDSEITIAASNIRLDAEL